MAAQTHKQKLCCLFFRSGSNTALRQQLIKLLTLFPGRENVDILLLMDGAGYLGGLLT
jgi:hypothetical protein